MSMTGFGDQGALQLRSLMDRVMAGVAPDIIGDLREATAMRCRMSITFQSVRLKVAVDRWKVSYLVPKQFILASCAAELDSEIVEVVSLVDAGCLTRAIPGQEGSAGASNLTGFC